MNLKDTYNKIATDWANDHHGDTWWIEGVDKFLSLLPPGGRVLDVGCGAGVKTAYLLEQGYEAVGIDFSEKMIELAQERVPTGNFFVKDIKKPLAFTDKFDGIFAQAVLLHIPKKEVLSVLENLVSNLKPGGSLYIAVKAIRADGPEEEVVKENDYGYEYERFFSYYSLSEMKEYLKQLGFEVVFEHASTASNGRGWIQLVGKLNE